MGESAILSQAMAQAALHENPASLFPLPLSPFEKFFLWDERPAQPMSSFIELHFESPLDQGLLADALTVAVHRNPLLASRVSQQGKQWFWDYDARYRPRLRAMAEEPPLVHGWPVAIDLRKECGSRYWYEQTLSGSRLLIQLHHACCDGLGLRRVLIDALTGYARGVQSSLTAAQATEKVDESSLSDVKGKPARWEAVALESLVDRFDFSGSFSGPPSLKLSLWQRICNAHYFHFQLPIALTGQPSSAEELKSLPPGEPLRHHILSRELSERILDRSRTAAVGINEIALALLFRACCQWNARQNSCFAFSNSRNSRIRILMPYDLRSRIDLRMPAANRLSFSFLGRNCWACDDLPELLASLGKEVQEIKDSRLPLDFLAALDLAAKSPRLMRWVIARSRRMATVVLTYTGDVSRGMKKYFPEQDGGRLIGNARLTNILVAPPVRKNTNIALGLCINWGQLCISAAWNREAMSAVDCEEFLQLYAQGWSEWLE